MSGPSAEERAERLVPDVEPESGDMSVWSVAGIEIRSPWPDGCESVVQARNAIIAEIRAAEAAADAAGYARGIGEASKVAFDAGEHWHRLADAHARLGGQRGAFEREGGTIVDNGLGNTCKQVAAAIRALAKGAL